MSTYAENEETVTAALLAGILDKLKTYLNYAEIQMLSKKNYTGLRKALQKTEKGLRVTGMAGVILTYAAGLFFVLNSFAKTPGTVNWEGATITGLIFMSTLFVNAFIIGKKWVLVNRACAYMDILSALEKKEEFGENLTENS